MLIPNKALNPAITTGADNTTVNSGNNANTATKIRKTIGVAIPAAFAASTIKFLYSYALCELEGVAKKKGKPQDKGNDTKA